jgi:hypothetical protein
MEVTEAQVALKDGYIKAGWQLTDEHHHVVELFF